MLLYYAGMVDHHRFVNKDNTWIVKNVFYRGCGNDMPFFSEW